MTRRAYVDHNARRLFYWSPKAGCTSFVRWFMINRLGVRYKDYKDRYSGPRGYLDGEGYGLDHKEANKLALEEGYETVALVRHPATRVLSAYLNKFVLYGGDWLTSRERLEPFVQMSLRQWGYDESDDQLYAGISFSQFLDVLSKHVKAAGRACPKLDNHWNIQSQINDAATTFSFDHIFKIEEMNLFSEWLKEQYGIDADIEHKNQTKYETSETYADYSELSSVEIAEAQYPLHANSFLQQHTLEKIHQIFATDFDVFNYDPMVIPQR
ncbi:sulfotransferase family 2 domain-containing protein [Kordiimonas sp. SCSIO 12603]|uniref:sulfotransferase family 2 domain-containing protein n=1 Tax=Kordiimonas sp. SCSIO 12603 TaxID=2829596 RepID=UPI00210223B4|nr:sulfotransferase family 2 domain-containing protein [Kordiimonas sp. SCSIO 12603]UTW60019.1 sulfotransferase family 2 domain-containing protein [Kordiimonas sp. SCSIO 12603]